MKVHNSRLEMIHPDGPAVSGRVCCGLLCSVVDYACIIEKIVPAASTLCVPPRCT